jgi:4-amino-4-deoxy-L-arabinose transferase-like glycosyltransferase
MEIVPEADLSPRAGFLRREPARIAVLLLFAGAIRLFHLGSVPPGLFCDEAAIAANADSLGLTGRDLGGELLPLYAHERSFERWNQTDIVYQPVYLYAAVPSVRVFGRSATGVRLPAVLFGLLGVAGTYVLGRTLFGTGAALWAAGLLAVSPWHVHFSRIGFEAISLPVFLAFGSWALFRGLTCPRFLLLGAGLLGIATYAYPSGRLFAPLLLAVFYGLQVRTLRERPGPAGAALALFALLVLPHLFMILADVHQERLHRLLISTAPLENERAAVFLRSASGNALASAILGHRGALVPFTFLYNYVHYFSPSFLFLRGDPNPRHGLGAMGACYWIYLPLLGCGLAFLFRERREAHVRFVLTWLFAYPIPASLAIESPHAIRAITALPVLELVAALGAARILALTGSAAAASSPGLRRAAWGVVILVFVAGPAEVLFYLQRYHLDYPRTAASAWQAGVGEGIRRATRERGPGQVAHVSADILGSYLLVLVHGEVDLRSLARSGDLNARLAPFRYRILFPGEPVRLRKGDVALLTSRERPGFPGLRPVAEFPFPDGSPNLFLGRSEVE